MTSVTDWLCFHSWTMYGPVPTGLVEERLAADLLGVVDGEHVRDRVHQRRREVGERVLERDLQRVLVESLDAAEERGLAKYPVLGSTPLIGAMM